MNWFTIYCTEEQTRKALALGAPIEQYPYYDVVKYEVRNFFHDNKTRFMFPTAEQMIGWLTEKMKITTFHVTYFPVHEKYGFLIIADGFVLEIDADNDGRFLVNTRKEATLLAISYALDWLL